MKITSIHVTVRELTNGYKDDGDGGVYAYGGNLVVRPSYQREFVYKEKQRNAVIDTVRAGFPLNTMYWSKNDEGYEVLDGQQRTISICQYVNKEFAINVNGNDKFFHNLTEEEKNEILDYELSVYVCEGTEAEKLEWFRVVNIAGVTLTEQELLNAAFTGPWLADAKNYFSKRNCVAGQMADGFIKGNPIRQEYLAKVLSWAADRDGLPDGEHYMAIHQHDSDANDLWLYFQEVTAWAKRLFPKTDKRLTESQEWGLLYNQYKGRSYNANTLDSEIRKLALDDDVTKKVGIIPYLLSDRTMHDEKELSIRAFTQAQKIRAYERQHHRCANCVKNGIDTEYKLEEMQADHIIPWSKGGRTTDDNLQMLCQKCNNDKRDA